MWSRVALALLLSGSLIACSSQPVKRAAAVVPHGRLLGVAGDRLVYLAPADSKNTEVGDVRSVRADGSGEVALGGGGGKDIFHGIAGGLVFLSIAGPAPEVRAVSFDGSVLHSRPGSVGLLFSRGTVVAAHGAGFELLDASMKPAPLRVPAGANILALLDDGRVRALTAEGSYATLSAAVE